MLPTKEQSVIIEETNSCVVIAKPGSGKTFTLSKKIKKILPDLPDFKGVIAISYTNKASDELKHRSLDGGLDKKGSFFGTIDKFFVSEIILPFGKYVFGNSKSSVEIFNSRLEQFVQLQDDKRVTSLLEIGYSRLETKHIEWIKNKYHSGIIFLELIGIMSMYIFDNSIACKNYLKARYSHIIIDEYQDSGKEQHEMFLRLKQLGLCAIAVGDGDQSIFGFAKKDSRYLLELAQIKDRSLKLFSLNKNHRSHSSIINYSNAFLNSGAILLPEEEIRVFEKRIIGNQFDIAKWIDSNISKILNTYGVNNENQVGILVRGDTTGKILNNNLLTNHKYFQNTPLDNDSNIWSQLFKEVLNVVFDKNSIKYELVEKYIDINSEPSDAKNALQILNKIKNDVSSTPLNIQYYEKELIELATILIPNGENGKSIELLNMVLSNYEYIISYIPAKSSEVQIMSIHKSKGLEFDIVFHLDLYQYILPAYKGDIIQDSNLHYVGITRAKKALFLIWSTERFNGSGDRKRGIKSDFLVKENLLQHRKVVVPH